LSLKSSLNLGKTEVLGLDIGLSSVKMVQLQKKYGSYNLTAACWGEIPPAQNHDPQQRRANTISTIRKCVKETGFKTGYAVCGIGGSEVTVRGFSFPSIPIEEIEQVVKLEAAQVCPFDIENSTIDYALLENNQWQSPLTNPKQLESSENISGVMAAASNKIIQDKRDLVDHSSLNCVLMDVESLSLLNCFTEQEKLEPDHSVTLLNVGSSYTSLVIIPDQGLPFVRDLP